MYALQAIRQGYRLEAKVVLYWKPWHHSSSDCPGPPIIRPEWKKKLVDDSKIPDLLEWITDLKHDKIIGVAVVMDWMKRRI